MRRIRTTSREALPHALKRKQGIPAALCVLAIASAPALPPELPEPIPAAPHAHIEVAGFSGTAAGTPMLERVTDEFLTYPLEITGQEDGELELLGELGAAEAGVYILEVPRSGEEPFRRLATIHRPPELLVNGPEADHSYLPLATGTPLTNAEWLILPEEIGRGGQLTGIELFTVPGAELPGGAELTVRLKESPLTAFPDDSLDADGWTTVHNGSLPGPADGGSVTIPLDTAFPVSASQSLHVSVIIEADQPVFAEAVRHVDGRGERFRAGISGDQPVPPEDWTGSTPSLRTLEDTMPLTRLHFAGLPVMADFDAEETNVAVGEEVVFRNLSSANASQWSWDLTGDGASDATAREPRFAYPEPGEYTVELIASDGYAQAARLRQSFIRVLPATGLCTEWLRFD